MEVTLGLSGVGSKRSQSELCPVQNAGQLALQSHAKHVDSEARDWNYSLLSMQLLGQATWHQPEALQLGMGYNSHQPR